MKNNTFALLFKANLFLTIVLFCAFLWHYHAYTLYNFLFTLIAAISTATLLSAILYLFLTLFSFHTKTKILLTMLVFMLTDIALIIDFFIFKLFHFHINAMVLNIIISPDAMDSIQTGITPIIAFIVAILILLYLEFWVLNTIQKISISQRRYYNSKLNTLIAIPLVLIFFSEKIGYGFATLFSKNTLVAPFKVIPLYQPLTFTKIASKYFGFKAQEQAKYSIQTNATLKYPLVSLEIDRSKATFPIFVIALDSVRYTAITPALTPHINTFAQDAIVLKHHFSGGNSTRFGIFSLMYGLNATYWFSFLHANQKPVLFDILQQRNYDIHIFSSTNTNWPEFRKTCYVAIQDTIQDSFEGEPWKKDAQSSQCFIDQIHSYDNTKPLFTFIFLDAPHGYSYPPDANIYQAPEGAINYLSITPDSEALKTIEKRYKNALHYNDMLVGKMLQVLKDKGLYEKSLILFTSDHGQEFFEYGNFGHNTSFSLSQTQVPMMIKLPEFIHTLQAPKGITSHQDIVPTLLSLLGVKNPAKTYSNGHNIFDNNYHRDYTFCANWNNNAILTPKTISVFSNLPNKMFGNEVHETQSYTKLPNTNPKSKFILDTMNENKKFLK